LPLARHFGCRILRRAMYMGRDAPFIRAVMKPTKIRI